MPIYHYTSAAGLTGIIGSKSLWATDHRFLNDTSEFTHGWAIVFDALKRRKPELDKVSDGVWNTIELFQLYGEKVGVFAFVGSLTSEGDLLSQWRGYSGGKGFAVGFNEDWLQRNATEQGFDIQPVLYVPDEQRRAAEQVVDLLVRLLSASAGIPSIDLTKLMRKWWMSALKVALILKDSNFQEECERRLFWVGLNWPPEVKTRVAATGIIPYCSCRLDKTAVKFSLHPDNFGIEEIIVGPALGRQQIAAVDALQATRGMRTTVRKSAIPFMGD